MTFLDLFAGIGGFRRGMELAGHKCVGFCEINPYAVASYISMHTLTNDQREKLSALDLKSRQKEILKEEYRNGEWYADDISRVYPGDMPTADCWCFGFPCQDISIAGEKRGLQGNRSSLFYRVINLLGQLREEDKPTFLLIENVRNLLNVNEGWDFARILFEMDKSGYDAEWKVLNSKDFGVAQDRRRVFIVGFSREKCSNGILSPGKFFESTPTQNPKVCCRTLVSRYPGNVNGSFIEDPRGIRKMTPRECFRLQGWSDEYFDRAAFVNANPQLYEQAGNGVTVNVVHAIAERLRMGA